MVGLTAAALFRCAWRGSGADDERLAGGLHDFAGHGPQLVDLEHAPDLREQAVNEP
jgi:hypothetical protein